MQKTYLAMAIALLSSTVAWADDMQELEQVTVRGTAIPLPARSVNTMTAQEIAQRNATDLKTLLQDQVGVEVDALSRLRQGNDSINLRGLTGNRVGMNIDGIELPEAQESRVFSTVGLAFGRGNYIENTGLRSVTINRGAEANGLAGSLQFRTLTPEDVLTQDNRNWGGYVQGAYNSADNSQAWTAAGALRQGAWKGLLLGTYRYGHATKTRGDVAGWGATRTKANPQDYHSRYFLTSHQFDINAQHRVSLTAEYLNRHQYIHNQSALTSATDIDNMWDENRRKRVSISHQYQSDTGSLRLAQTSLYYQDNQTDNLRYRSLRNRTDDAFIRNQVSGINGQHSHVFAGSLQPVLRYRSLRNRTDDAFIRDQVWGINGQYSHVFAGSLQPVLRYGFSLAQHDLTNNLITTSAPNQKPFADTKRLNAALFAESDLTAGNWVISPALRWDYYQLKPRTDNGYVQRGLDTTHIAKQSHHQLSPRIGLVWKLSPAFQPYAQFAYGFKAPSSQQLTTSYGNTMRTPMFSVDYAVVGNPNLKPETARNLELGLRGRTDTWSYQISVYDNRYHNFIDNVVLDNTPSHLRIQYQNFARARIYGTEMQAAWQFAPNWKLNGSLAYARGYVKDSTGKSPINTVMPFKAKMGLAYEQQAFGVNGALTYVARKSNSQIQSTVFTYNPTRPYFLFDLGAYWQPMPALRITANVKNVFNKKYWNWADLSHLAARDSNSGAYNNAMTTVSPNNADSYSATGRSLNLSVRYTF